MDMSYMWIAIAWMGFVAILAAVVVVGLAIILQNRSQRRRDILRAEQAEQSMERAQPSHHAYSPVPPVERGGGPAGSSQSDALGRSLSGDTAGNVSGFDPQATGHHHTDRLPEDPADYGSGPAAGIR